MAGATFITLDTAFTDTSLPTLPDWDTVIGQNADVAQWAVPDAARVTLNGVGIASITDRSNKAQNLAQATAAAQPRWVDNEFNGLPAMSFDSDDYFVSGISMPTSGDFTIVSPIKSLVFGGNSRYLFSGGNGGTAGFYVRITSDGRFSFLVKGSGSNSSTGLASDGAAKAVVLFWDEANKQATLRFNGTELVAAPAISISPLSNSTLWVGTDPTLAFKFTSHKMGEILPIKANLKNPANAALWASVQSYYLNRYGLTL